MSARLYAFAGAVSGELLTFRGAVLTHLDRAEMAFLMPGQRVVELATADMSRPLMRLCDHPDLAAVQWPLRREQFR